MNAAGVLHHHADRFPERVAVGFDGEAVTYAGLVERAAVTAGALRSLGVGRGDVVAHLLYNSLDFIDLMVACAQLGAVFMPLNWRLAGPELEYIVNHAGARVLVSEAELEPLVAPVRAGLVCERFVRVGAAGEGGPATGADAWEPLDGLRAAAAPVREIARVDRDDVLRLMYTSGTTARPKGVMITHGNLDAKNAAHAIELGFRGSDVGIVGGPLYHVGALDLTTTTLLHVGATTHILRKFDAAAVLDAIERLRGTTVWLAPAMVNLVLADPGLATRDLSSMRVIIDGGEKMPLPLIERVLDAFPNAWFADAYGLTETVSGDTFLDKGLSRHKLGSVGKPVIHLELRVVDAADEDVPAGEPGEIVLRGPKVCKGYWRDEEATARAFRGGWFHTGDVGILDDEGFLTIADRIKDMVISGGENIATPEVERVLYEHPAVLEAAVVGSPDPRWGEVPAAYVALRPGSEATAEEIVAFCAARLAKFKAPKIVRFVDTLPRNPSGKVLKRELRDEEQHHVERT
jgi:acyl-CoA synthetase (AMP-forming)/AMP-acid ligase II